MVNISQETAHETESRLRRVIQQCRLAVFEGAYAFEEFPLADFAKRAKSDALALVRDDQVWSQLVIDKGTSPEPFAIWRFHFPAGADNSGFVGWLATHLKRTFGTGVFVICGQNSDDGGIFDYWGCPLLLGPEIMAEVQDLVSGNPK
jgi:Family of unknown function (DUF6196)